MAFSNVAWEFDPISTETIDRLYVDRSRRGRKRSARFFYGRSKRVFPEGHGKQLRDGTSIIRILSQHCIVVIFDALLIYR